MYSGNRDSEKYDGNRISQDWSACDIDDYVFVPGLAKNDNNIEPCINVLCGGWECNTWEEIENNAPIPGPNKTGH